MSNFKALEGDTAILCRDGVYTPVDLYTWGGALFAKIAGGYVRLRADGTTSKDKTRLVHLETEYPLFRDRLGRLTLDGEGAGHRPITLTDDGVLLVTTE